jgi:hypothetical protein
MDAHGATSEEYRRRTAALRALARVPDTGFHQARWSAAREEALRAFGGERELVLAAHQRWQVHLLARLDQVIEQGGDHPHEEVRRAVEDLSRAMPGLAALLRRHGAEPSLAIAQQRLAGYVDRACPCGQTHPLVAPAPRPSRVRRAVRFGRGVAARRCPIRRLLVSGIPAGGFLLAVGRR